MARGKATKKKGKDMKTIFVIVIVVLVLAFVLFMQYQKPVVEDGGELAQMFGESNGKPSSDFNLIPTPKSFNCPMSGLEHCKKLQCPQFAYGCMLYCQKEGLHCCMISVHKVDEDGKIILNQGHVMNIGQVEPEPNHPDEHRFCIFEPQFGPDEYTPCCWYQDKNKGKTPLKDEISNECMEKIKEDGFDVVRKIKCTTRIEDIVDICTKFKLNKKLCKIYNEAFEGAGYELPFPK